MLRISFPLTPLANVLTLADEVTFPGSQITTGLLVSRFSISPPGASSPNAAYLSHRCSLEGLSIYSDRTFSGTAGQTHDEILGKLTSVHAILHKCIDGEYQRWQLHRACRSAHVVIPNLHVAVNERQLRNVRRLMNDIVFRACVILQCASAIFFITDFFRIQCSLRVVASVCVCACV
jgi:hypothetical protein